MNLEEIKDAIGVKPYYEEPAGVIYNADCLDILQKIPEKSVDLVCTDPPWGKPISYSDSDRSYEPVNFLPSCYNILKSGGLIYCFWNAKAIPEFQNEFVKLFKLKNLIVIWKQNHASSPWDKAAFQYQWEPLFYGSKDQPDIDISNISCNISIPNGDVWRSLKPQSNFVGENKRSHDCQKPLSVLRKCLTFSIGNIIIDPFLGSGTTAVAAKQLGRQYIGIEISEKYCDIAVQRLAQEILI